MLTVTPGTWYSASLRPTLLPAPTLSPLISLGLRRRPVCSASTCVPGTAGAGTGDWRGQGSDWHCLDCEEGGRTVKVQERP